MPKVTQPTSQASEPLLSDKSLVLTSCPVYLSWIVGNWGFRCLLAAGPVLKPISLSVPYCPHGTWKGGGSFGVWGSFYGCTLSQGRADVTSQHLEEITARTCWGTGRQGISMWEYSIFQLHWVKQGLGSIRQIPPILCM